MRVRTQHAHDPSDALDAVEADGIARHDLGDGGARSRVRRRLDVARGCRSAVVPQERDARGGQLLVVEGTVAPDDRADTRAREVRHRHPHEQGQQITHSTGSLEHDDD